MYDPEQAQTENAGSVILFATQALLLSTGWHEGTTVSVTGGEEGIEGVRSYELTVTIPKNDPLKTGLSDDEDVQMLIESIIADLQYDFAVRRNWLIHADVVYETEHVTIQSSSPWSVPTS